MGLRFIEEKILLLTAVDATPLDGSTAGRTYLRGDAVSAYLVGLGQTVDAVEIFADCAGSDGNTAVFNILGYPFAGKEPNPLKPEIGPALKIYDAVTVTLGTAVAGTGRLFVEHFTGTDKHTKTIGLYDNALGGNSIAKMAFDTRGLAALYFEPITFTTLTDIKFHIRTLELIK
jgi:hypothetical protein